MNLEFAKLVLDYELRREPITPDGHYWDKVFTKDDQHIAFLFYGDGTVNNIRFYKGKHWHRPHTDGPADIIYYPNGNISYSMYFEDNIKHRPRHLGPAFIEYNKDGTIYDTAYFEHGVGV